MTLPAFFGLPAHISIPQWSYLPLAASLAVGAGLLDMPYGYYMLLRLVLSGSCVALLMKGGRRSSDEHRAALVILAILHNPVIPVHLNDRRLWNIVDVATAGYFWFLCRGIGSTY
jgi:Family of unknown function (DUF6804)